VAIPVCGLGSSAFHRAHEMRHGMT
jgi:hypothetical protein